MVLQNNKNDFFSLLKEVNEQESINWLNISTLPENQCFYNNMEMNMSKLMQEQGLIKTQPTSKKYIYLWLHFEPTHL